MFIDILKQESKITLMFHAVTMELMQVLSINSGENRQNR